jgi:uncharacterized coiled-coil protein SlyX
MRAQIEKELNKIERQIEHLYEKVDSPNYSGIEKKSAEENLIDLEKQYEIKQQALLNL